MKSLWSSDYSNCLFPYLWIFLSTINHPVEAKFIKWWFHLYYSMYVCFACYFCCCCFSLTGILIFYSLFRFAAIFLAFSFIFPALFLLVHNFDQFIQLALNVLLIFVCKRVPPFRRKVSLCGEGRTIAKWLFRVVSCIPTSSVGLLGREKRKKEEDTIFLEALSSLGEEMAENVNRGKWEKIICLNHWPEQSFSF